jgi:Na+/H+ antiporter NhaD/arsenite permease-like protein
MLAIGSLLAGLMGTTGAAMVLIHPLLRANAHRKRKVHIVVFFIFVVANAGGATTPLGDPPLYLGFLRGVPFLWPLEHLLLPLLLIEGALLAIFIALDHYLARAEPPPPQRERFRLRGLANVLLLAVVVLTVLVQGIWRGPSVSVLGQTLGLERVAGVGVFLAVTLASVVVTPRAVRHGNLFSWHPIEEVAKLFAALFLTIGPVMAMLDAGLNGPMAPLLRLTQDAHGAAAPVAYFWLTGVLSAFLDNAPTYLVFYELAGGDPARLTTELAHVLAAISAGAVFFGALTYIGNAPNLMVRSIASHRGVRMPGFFGFMAWSCVLLLPVFGLATLLFFL